MYKRKETMTIYTNIYRNWPYQIDKDCQYAKEQYVTFKCI